MKTEHIIETLRRHHRPPDWVFFHELRCGPGWGTDKGIRHEQRLDAWAMHCWPSRRYQRIAYEVKVSRQDFQHELKHSEKRQGALLLSNESYFVTPPHLVSAGEVPEECGLLYVTAGGKIIRQKEAPWRACGDIPPGFVNMLARRMLLKEYGLDGDKGRNYWWLQFEWVKEEGE